MSYPYDDRPYDTTCSRTCPSTNGSIMPCSRAMRLIQRSAFMLMVLREIVARSGLPRRSSVRTIGLATPKLRRSEGGSAAEPVHHQCQQDTQQNGRRQGKVERE